MSWNNSEVVLKGDPAGERHLRVHICCLGVKAKPSREQSSEWTEGSYSQQQLLFRADKSNEGEYKGLLRCDGENEQRGAKRDQLGKKRAF